MQEIKVINHSGTKSTGIHLYGTPAGGTPLTLARESASTILSGNVIISRLARLCLVFKRFISRFRGIGAGR